MDIHKKAMLQALEKTLGVVSTACKTAEITRQTHYNWYNSDPEYKEAVDSIGEVALDFAESKLHSKINEGDTTAIIFYLKTKGKKRGYIERSELGITAMKPTDIIDIRFGDKTTPSRQSTESTGAAEAV